MRPATTKIVLCVIDGLGGLARQETLRSELEAASIPNLDRLAAKSEVGLTVPVGPGITPGSGPGHLALFGYDPLRFEVGRGVLEAVGIQFALRPGDVAVRANFCTLDSGGRIVDRRAGRIASEEAEALVGRLGAIRLADAEVLVAPVKEHRFVVVFRGTGLGPNVSDTDPQATDVEPLAAEAADEGSARTARAANAFAAAARDILRNETAANGVLLRGFSTHPDFPPLTDVWGLRAAAVAGYPMYRGLARLVGMDLLPASTDLGQQIETVRAHWDEYDYFFVHYKDADTAGEDGDFEAKCHALERFDGHVSDLLGLAADVLIIAGDHSTPALLGAHSWHPVPFMFHSTGAREGNAMHFNEQECLKGSLGIFPAVDVMPLAMANAGRLTKFGA